MKKFLVGLVAVLGLSSVAMAADPLPTYRARFGVNLGLSPVFGFGVFGSFDANRLATFAPNIGLGLRTGVNVAFGSTTVFGITAAPVAHFSVNPDTAVYVGPAIGLSAASGNTAFGFGITGGAEFAVSAPLNVFADATLTFVPNFVGSFAVGAEYQISPPLGLVGQAGLTFAGGSTGFGLGLGASYRF